MCNLGSRQSILIDKGRDRINSPNYCKIKCFQNIPIYHHFYSTITVIITKAATAKHHKHVYGTAFSLRCHQRHGYKRRKLHINSEVLSKCSSLESITTELIINYFKLMNSQSNVSQYLLSICVCMCVPVYMWVCTVPEEVSWS